MKTTEKRVLALGFFDGVHVGHGALLKRTKEIAQKLGAKPTVLTFDTHPENLIVGDMVPLITSKKDREYLVRRYFGIEETVFIHFDETMMHMPWERFVSEVLQENLGAGHVVAGHDFHFGYKGMGNPQRLKEKCAELGMGCDIISKVEYDGITISSTYIRKLIAQGEIERANEFLGHPYTLSGTVLHGKKLGGKIGFPTANIEIESGILVPFKGVYATKVLVGNAEYIGVTNVGTRPTVNGESLTVETHIPELDRMLYGEEIRIDFYKLLRPEKRFDCLEALKQQIAADTAEACEYFDK